MADAFSVKFDFSGIDSALGQIESGAQSLVRPAAQAGAQVLYDEVKLRAPVSKKARKLKSGRIIEPGALRASIYQVYSESSSTPEKATYHVSWNYRKAPHGHLVENGTSRAPAHPFLRPSFDARQKDALKASEAKIVSGMSQVIAGLKS